MRAPKFLDMNHSKMLNQQQRAFTPKSYGFFAQCVTLPRVLKLITQELLSNTMFFFSTPIASNKRASPLHLAKSLQVYLSWGTDHVMTMRMW